MKKEKKKFRFKLGYGCNCKFCTKHIKEKLKNIRNCGCVCHSGVVAVGHDGLCCEAPNVKLEFLDTK